MEKLNNISVEELLNRINSDLRNTLSEKRYKHSLGVMKKAEELVLEFQEDISNLKEQ